MIKIFQYPYSQKHNKQKTDELICDSVEKYCRQENICVPVNLKVKRTTEGKPYIEGENGIYVSVSHSEKLLLIAVSDREIGIDCESFSRKIRNPEALAVRFFTALERDFLANVTEAEKNCAFIKIWVAKEALVKLSGEGLAAISSADSQNPPPKTTILKIDDFDGYAVAVASCGGEIKT